MDAIYKSEEFMRRFASVGKGVQIFAQALILKPEVIHLAPSAATSPLQSSPAVIPPEAPAVSGHTPPSGFSEQIKAMLFADVVGYSKLTEAEVPRFVEHFMGAVAALMAASPHAPVVQNTWGDALFFVFDTVADAGLFALALRDRLCHTAWAEKGLPQELTLRIALHAGPVTSGVDPVTKQRNYVGSHVSWAARIEPITPPGHVYASQPFAALAAAQGVSTFTCDYVGQVPLPKGYGTFPTYHVRYHMGTTS